MTTPFSFGKPASATSDLQKKFGAAGGIGARGETQYLKALRNALPPGYTITHSLSIPETRDDKAAMSGDVDVAIASGNKLVLIDVKAWKGPSSYWSPAGVLAVITANLDLKAIPLLVKPWRGFRPYLLNGKWKASQNMLLALNRYRKRLKGADVSAMVVFVPANGAPPRSVHLLGWPGGISSFRSKHSFEEIINRLGPPTPPTPAIKQLLAEMSRTS